MTRIDEFSSGYEWAGWAPRVVAAAVKSYTEMTSCAFKMIHAPVPLLLLFLSVRFIPPITPAAASPPAPPHQWGLRLRCQTRPSLQVNLGTACSLVLHGCNILWKYLLLIPHPFMLFLCSFLPLRYKHVAPRFSSGTSVSTLRVLTHINGKELLYRVEKV